MAKSGIFSLLAVSLMIYLSCTCAYAAIDMNKIVGLWLFENEDEDPGIAMDSSGRGHDGQVSDTEWTDGKFGRALLFNGTSSVVTVPDAEDLTLSTFTCAAWFNCAGPNEQWQGMVGKDSWPVRNYSLYIHMATETVGSNFVHDANPDAHKEIVGATNAIDGQWHHAAVTYDMQNYSIYFDGALDGQRAVTNEPDENALPVRIGREGVFNGILDEVVVFSEALEADDIARLMEGFSKILTPVESAGKLATVWGGLKSYE